MTYNAPPIKDILAYSNYKISTYHRERLGMCYAIDLDLVEYDANGDPVAIIEFKHFNVRKIDFTDPKLRAQQRLADKASLPFFVVVYYLLDDEQYSGKQTQFYVISGNDTAVKLLASHNNQPANWCSESSYARLTHLLRNIPLPSHLVYSTSVDRTQRKPDIIYDRSN